MANTNSIGKWQSVKNLFKRLGTLHYTRTERKFLAYAGSWLVIFIFGIVVYYALYSSYPVEGNRVVGKSVVETHNGVELLVRSMASSLDLFFFNIDSNGVDGWLDAAQSGVWGWLLAVVAILAGGWTISVVGLLVWSLIKQWVKKISTLLQKDTHLYIFVGINNPSKLLAADVQQKKDPKDLFLFLVPPDDDEEANTSVWDKLSKKMNYKHHLYQDVAHLDGQILIAEKKIVDCTNDTKNGNIWQEIGLPLMQNYIQNSAEIDVLLLGENETENIYDALRLANDTLLKPRHKQVTIHCRARRGNVNRIVEDLPESSMIEVVDASYMAVEMLKNDVANHPVSFVQLSETNPGTVSSAFHSLIIGFSETGIDAFRFLYEFSAFVVMGCEQEEDRRSPFYCDIVDKQFSAGTARWKNLASRIFGEETRKGQENFKHITFHEMDYGSDAFYEKVLRPKIKQLQYVVVAVGDDRTGITIAADILRYAIKMGRVDLAHPQKTPFRIYVRSYDPSLLAFMQQVADHLNGGASFITIFGSEQEVYSKHMLVDNLLKDQAMEYYYHYTKVTVEHLGEGELRENKEEQWASRRADAFNPESQYCKKNHGKYGATMDLRREEGQDYANAMHKHTKEYLYEHGAPLLRLAQTEHLRWVAAHELMGFEPSVPDCTTKEIVRYCHPGMVSWSKIEDWKKAYDYITLYGICDEAAVTQAISSLLSDPR